jgi:hypothetical protein
MCLGPICKYFSEIEGPAITLQNHRDHRLIYNKFRDLIMNRCDIWKFSYYSPMGNPMDRVHGVWTERSARVHGGPDGGADTGLTALSRRKACRVLRSFRLASAGRRGRGRRGDVIGVLTGA